MLRILLVWSLLVYLVAGGLDGVAALGLRLFVLTLTW